MSLCIAIIDNNEVFLMADTLLSFPEKTGKKPFHGLKIFFLNQNIAIAYSGAAGKIAHSRLYAIYTQGHKGNIKLLAKQICKSFDDKVDFLLAQSGEKPMITKISEGKISILEDDGIYWIGDADAANYVSKLDGNNRFQLQYNFENVIANSQFPTVGGHCVVARGKIEGFKLIPYMGLISPNYVQKTEDWETVDFGSAQTGGFGYTTVTPSKEGINGWGIFYFQGMYGQFWRVDFELNVLEVLKAYAANVEEFIKIIQDEIDIELDYCGSLGSK